MASSSKFDRCMELFLATLPNRNLGLGAAGQSQRDTRFRSNITHTLSEEFLISIGSASSVYAAVKNHIAATRPELIVGLGRAEGKNNGGRKAAPTATVTKPVENGAVVLVKGVDGVYSTPTIKPVENGAVVLVKGVDGVYSTHRESQIETA